MKSLLLITMLLATPAFADGVSPVPTPTPTVDPNQPAVAEDFHAEHVLCERHRDFVAGQKTYAPKFRDSCLAMEVRGAKADTAAALARANREDDDLAKLQKLIPAASNK